ncbi:MAG: serine/threonine-protein kinase [Deltaproteobacteria bacterium]|nr:serine/threonine-protein kinase [Deltaproteobacteria bacterium]
MNPSHSSPKFTARALVEGSIFAEDLLVESLLGVGGMGAVYRVLQRSTGRLRALKVLQPGGLADESAVDRLLREARVSSQIDSAHVVQVLDAGREQGTGTPYVLMELLEGEELGAFVTSRGGRLSDSEVVEILRQVCHALAAAHRVGVVHRDLKPENIFVAREARAGGNWTVKLLDFGIAAVVEAGATSHQTQRGAGSPAWMAPEQVEAGSVRPATDVWALGLLAYWLWTGRHYWRALNREGATLQALLVEKLVEPMEPASHRAQAMGLAGTLPLGFDGFFAHTAAREVSARFRDAGHAWQALEQLLASRTGPLQVHPHAPRPSMDPSAFMQTIATAPGTVLSPNIARATLPTATLTPSRGRGAKIALGLGLGVLLLVGVAAAFEQRERVAHEPPATRDAPQVPQRVPNEPLAQRRAPPEVPERLPTAPAVTPEVAPIERRVSRTPVVRRSARTLPPTTAPTAPTASPPSVTTTAPTAAPAGPPAGSRCSSYRVLEARANEAERNAGSDPVAIGRARMEARALRDGVDQQVRQLQGMANGPLADDPAFVSMVREVERCMVTLRAQRPPR